MAFTTKLLLTNRENIETDVKTYLDGQSITTLHSINVFTIGIHVCVFIVFE